MKLISLARSSILRSRLSFFPRETNYNEPARFIARGHLIRSLTTTELRCCKHGNSRSHGHPTNSSSRQIADHRQIGASQELWRLHQYSPGSPIFTPAGSHVFLRLQQFMRAQYPAYGFEEVVTPTLYKEELWKESGHWDNYKNDMFMVRSGKDVAEDSSKACPERLGLKPMNCPGHCLLYSHKPRSYRDLPIRYADFSPLHRDEISGALSGLTRTRRFHQDDGHIFCRMDQVKTEIAQSIDFMARIYRVLGFDDYRLVVSTRPTQDFLGEEAEWSLAEEMLACALKESRHGSQLEFQKGEGAFYGPKIDAIVRDSAGKEHQIGTVQLDFQLPKRFGLTYSAPPLEGSTKLNDSTEIEASSSDSPQSHRPVLIHRAIYGSIERLLALMIESQQGYWPFWLNPRAVTIVTVTDRQDVCDFAFEVAENLRGSKTSSDVPAQSLYNPSYQIETDTRGESLSRKVLSARDRQTSVIIAIGPKNVSSGAVDVDFSQIRDQTRLNRLIGDLRHARHGTAQTIPEANQNGLLSLRVPDLQILMKTITDAYI